MITNCPYCNNKLNLVNLNSLECDQVDHEFWIPINNITYWYILHKDSGLFMTTDALCRNIGDHKNIVDFNNISIEKATIFLKKLLKLKSFI